MTPENANEFVVTQLPTQRDKVLSILSDAALEIMAGREDRDAGIEVAEEDPFGDSSEDAFNDACGRFDCGLSKIYEAAAIICRKQELQDWLHSDLALHGINSTNYPFLDRVVIYTLHPTTPDAFGEANWFARRLQKVVDERGWLLSGQDVRDSLDTIDDGQYDAFVRGERVIEDGR